PGHSGILAHDHDAPFAHLRRDSHEFLAANHPVMIGIEAVEYLRAVTPHRAILIDPPVHIALRARKAGMEALDLLARHVTVLICIETREHRPDVLEEFLTRECPV